MMIIITVKIRMKIIIIISDINAGDDNDLSIIVKR